MKRDELERDLRERVFRGPGPNGADGSGVGLEVELFPVRTTTGSRVLLEGDEGGAGSRELLAAAAARPGWRLNGAGHGVPSAETPSGARVSFEPGGQLEYSSATLASLDALREVLTDELEAVRAAFSEADVALVARGVDPAPPSAGIPLQLKTPRYRRMARAFQDFEPAGRLMMRHTASIHVNVDWADDPGEEWDVANRLVPVFTALFANSPEFGGESTGCRSYRTLQWVHLDPLRSGPARGEASDPVEEYLEFALAAPAFLLGSEDPPYAPFSRWMGNGGVSGDDWAAHLSTLFPEVRPRGYLEFRSVDALPLEWAVVPAVLLRGLLHHPPTRHRARGLLPPAGRKAMEAAARCGLRDPRQRERARELARIGLEGARALGEPGQGTAIEVAEGFVDALLRRGRDPGDVPLEELEARLG